MLHRDPVRQAQEECTADSSGATIGRARSSERAGWWSAALIGFVLVAIGIGCLLWFHDGGTALAHARRAGMIRIGYAVEEPYAFLTASGHVTGEGPEIARVIAARLGIPRVDWRLTEFGNLLDGLESGKYDVIAAGMFITPERQQRVAFSRPKFQVGPGLLVRKGNPHSLHRYTDLIGAQGLRIAVLTGSTEETRLRQLGCPDERLVRVPDANSGRVAIQTGAADALALSAPSLRWMMLNAPAADMEMPEPLADGPDADLPALAMGGFVFRKDEPELRLAWDSELADFLGSEEHLRLVRRFGFTDAELPPSETPGRAKTSQR